MNSVLKLKTGDLVKLRNDKGWYTVIENQDSHPPTSLIVAFKDAGHMDLDDYNENGVFGKYFDKSKSGIDDRDWDIVEVARVNPEKPFLLKFHRDDKEIDSLLQRHEEDYSIEIINQQNQKYEIGTEINIRHENVNVLVLVTADNGSAVLEGTVIGGETDDYPRGFHSDVWARKYSAKA